MIESKVTWSDFAWAFKALWWTRREVYAVYGISAAAIVLAAAITGGTWPVAMVFLGATFGLFILRIAQEAGTLRDDRDFLAYLRAHSADNVIPFPPQEAS